MSLNPNQYGWRYTGEVRPGFADDPAPGQESVWDYPRPPRIEPERREAIVLLDSIEIARSTEALRVLETASPPTVYLPLRDVRDRVLVSIPGGSVCEWKGRAGYWSVEVDGRSAHGAAWGYPDPNPAYESLRDRVSFYPARVECWLDGERVRPQPGEFYGGWVTDEIVGPMKGAPGSRSW